MPKKVIFYQCLNYNVIEAVRRSEARSLQDCTRTEVTEHYNPHLALGPAI